MNRNRDYCLRRIRETAIEGIEDDIIRFNVVKYFARIYHQDAYLLAKDLVNLGYVILFDDASISKQQNKTKHHKVYGDAPMKRLTWKYIDGVILYYVKDIEQRT